MTGSPAPESPAWLEVMSQFAAKFSTAGVRAIIFVHGSLHGTDLFGMQRLDEVGGLKRGYSRGVSGLDALLAAMREESNGLPLLPDGIKPPLKNDDVTKNLVDSQVGDAGNFTSANLELFRTAVNKHASQPIECIRILWASEHHHLGRAIAAVRLLDTFRQLCERLELGEGQRVLVQAHGGAGLVLALASNLLCPSQVSGRPKLLGILTTYAQQTEQEELSAMVARIESLLATGSPLNRAALDIVTFGSPVRYGWDPSGIGRLLHVVNHRVLRTDGKTWLSKMELPQITMEMPIAWGGDYVQELAVAGSDALPGTEQAKSANKALWE
ncbi:MAG TPA: hypothetical protein VIU63_03130, partial [Nitrospira sp.]